MDLPDVNVLIYAFHRDSIGFQTCRDYLEGLLHGSERFGVSDVALSGLIRIATNPRIFDDAASPELAVAFCDRILSSPACVKLAPGPRHWPIFRDLCIQVGARGKLVPDAWFAALAIEHGCTWVSADRDFARFPNLRWRNPLDA